MIQPKARGATPYGAQVSRALYTEEDLGLEHLIASMQSKKHSEDYTKHSMDFEDGQPAPEAPKALDYAGRSPQVLELPNGYLQKHSTPAGLDYEELGSLTDPGLRDCPRARNILE